MNDHILMTFSPDGNTRTDFVCRPERAADARDAVSAFVARLHPAPTAHMVQNLLLLVSELVTNAVRHAGAVTALWLTADRAGVHVRVTDPSPAHPQDRTPDLTGRTGGFGWPMVQRLAQEVRVRRAPDGGKVILATVPR
ncbi:Anti-sigma F factor [Streptomyces sp. ADI96-02]|uniref:ATP-binding protein n=1 Tax=unclassified Streptomyces TaxID=2593676 RepID=UPI000F552A71|nr:ATP-binding protein [Streptomyces sp. ADI96-02]RPK68509.1 Anti-sigma F factor [Streptomyces sp. ADI96-02]